MRPTLPALGFAAAVEGSSRSTRRGSCAASEAGSSRASTTRVRIGQLTVSTETGSSTAAPALASASFSPCAAADQNAMSDQTTEWYLPS